MQPVIVYSTPTCPFCDMVKDFLREHNVPFQDFDVAGNQEKLREMISKTGQTAVPVIDIGGKIIIGFDEAALLRALGI
jgi:glutaredoxin-like YruB-family protein